MSGHEVDDDLGVHGGLEDGAALFQAAADLPGVGEGAVVADGDHLAAVLHHEGLGVDEHGGAGGGIAHVADGQIPRELIQDPGVEDLGHQPQAPVHADPFAVAGDDAAGLLAPVLEGVEAEIGDPGRVGMPVNAEDAAVFFGFVIREEDTVFRLPFSVFRFHFEPLHERLKGWVAAGFSLFKKLVAQAFQPLPVNAEDAALFTGPAGPVVFGFRFSVFCMAPHPVLRWRCG